MRPALRPSRALLPALALLLVACGGAPAPAPEAPRNLLLITVDTLRADALGAYGDTHGISPNIDALAARGVVFENAISQSSWTLPAIASILTSTYPSTHQVDHFRDALHPSFQTLGEVLSEAGFSTAAVTSHAFVGPRYGMEQGIEDFDDSLIAGNRQADLRISSPEVSERGMRWLGEASGGDERWFLWLHYFDPHFPYVRHDEPDDPEGRTRVDYRTDIEFTDHWIGEVLDELERLGLADDTLVVLVSDHGEEFREHDKLRHGYTLFSEVVRVPFLVRAPGVEPRRVAQAASGVDVLPTVLDLLDLPLPAAAVGRSLLPAMLGAELEPYPILSELQLHERYRSDSLQLDGWKLVLDHTGRAALGFAEYSGGPPTPDSPQAFAPAIVESERAMLFAIDSDPGERNDVAHEHPEKVAELRAILEALQHRARAAAGTERSAIEHSAEELDVLRRLGYVGGDESDAD